MLPTKKLPPLKRAVFRKELVEDIGPAKYNPGEAFPKKGKLRFMKAPFTSTQPRFLQLFGRKTSVPKAEVQLQVEFVKVKPGMEGSGESEDAIRSSAGMSRDMDIQGTDAGKVDRKITHAFGNF